jgi:hypothetical protein
MTDSPYELRLRVFLLALEPALRLARALRLDLDAVREAVDAQYVSLHRERGLSLEQIARRIGKSRRTVVTLARTAAATAQALSDSRSIALRREIVRRLSADGPLARELVVTESGVARPEADAAIDALLDDGFLLEKDGALHVALAWLPFDGASDPEKLDSVRHFLDAVSGALLGRFFATPPDDDAFARVLTFCAPRAELHAARTRLFEAMAETALDLDARAASEPSSVQVSLAFCVAHPGSQAPARERRSP